MPAPPLGIPDFDIGDVALLADTERLRGTAGPCDLHRLGWPRRRRSTAIAVQGADGDAAPATAGNRLRAGRPELARPAGPQLRRSAAEVRLASPAAAPRRLDLHHHRQDHRPAAQARVDELRHVVVEVV